MEFFLSLHHKLKRFYNFQLSTQFKGKVQMVQRHTIPHVKPLIVDIKNLEGQGRGNISSLPRPLFLKSTFFTKSGRGRSITKPCPQSSGFKIPTIRAFK